MDYFAVFSLPRKLNLNIAALEKVFYTQSRRLHPDRFAARPQSEQEEALAASSRLNDAYRTLRDPVLRTQHLLTLEGIELEEQSKAATEAARTSGVQKKQLIPPELLEEVFELNMQFMELRGAREMGDEADPDLRRELEAAAQTFDGKMAETQKELEALWARWDATVPDNKTNQTEQMHQPGDQAAEQIAARDAMVTLLNKRSYLRNLVRDVQSALE